MALTHTPRSFFRLGLALSGGSLRGAGHLGILQVLEENGIIPDIVAGVSAGALVAALYARGMPVPSMITRATQLALTRLIDWDISLWTVGKFLLLYPLYRLGLRPNPKTLLPAGFIRGNRLESYIHRLLRRYPRRRIPCLLLATDLYHAETAVFGSLPSFPLPREHRYIRLREDEWARAVRASCSLPGVFQPTPFRGRRLVDGAVRNTLPADLLFLAGAQRVIAVDLHLGELEDRRLESFVDIIDRSLTLMFADLAGLRLSPYPALRLAPPVPDIGWTDYHRIPECIDAGRRYALSRLPDIRAYLKGSPPKA
ncbi:MAG: patatin-like phospholipase family protein [Kyrpidia sp.]|nr:patatin-like phospholipase family protein [Kyrpidia sp.]